MKKEKSGFKKTLLSLVSLVALIIIGWLLFFGRSRMMNFISPYLGKIPKDEGALVEYTDDVLGKAIEAAKGGRIKSLVGKGSEFFESSQYAEPGREIRENVKTKINEVVESLKELPAKELKIIKMEIYKQWFSDIATEGANLESNQ
jgi:hypothetical protein